METSEYEQVRIQNIARNLEFLASIGLYDSCLKAPQSKKRKSRDFPSEQTGLRRSTRLEGVKVDYQVGLRTT